LFSILVFLVSFAFWLGQPQPVKNYSYVNIPELSSTTTVPVAVETTVVETTIPTETTIDPALVESTVPSETTVLP
jgi:hypothetical protein